MLEQVVGKVITRGGDSLPLLASRFLREGAG
jgi:hypothetical protein